MGLHVEMYEINHFRSSGCRNKSNASRKAITGSFLMSIIMFYTGRSVYKLACFKSLAIFTYSEDLTLPVNAISTGLSSTVNWQLGPKELFLKLKTDSVLMAR